MNSSLSQLIGRVCEENPNEHPHKIARLVGQATADEDVAEFYVMALERLVSDYIRLQRNAAMNSQPAAGRSANLEDIVNHHQRLLRQQVFVGDGKYKAMRDCTADDLRYCIDERQIQVGRLQGQILKFQVILAAMEQHGAVTVGDLPEGSVQL